MKKKHLVTLALLMVTILLLGACSRAEETETTVNLPVVGGTGSQETEAPVGTAPYDTYPVSGNAQSEPQTSPITTYPVDTTSPTYDAEMQAFIETKLEGAHDINFLLEQDFTVEQWKEVLGSPTHTHVLFSPGELDAVITWLMSK